MTQPGGWSDSYAFLQMLLSLKKKKIFYFQIFLDDFQGLCNGNNSLEIPGQDAHQSCMSTDELEGTLCPHSLYPSPFLLSSLPPLTHYLLLECLPAFVFWNFPSSPE